MASKAHSGSGKHKGKPSQEVKGSGLKDQAIDQETEKEIIDKYMDSEDDVSPNVHERHPNRNIDKDRDDQGNKNKDVAKANIGSGDARDNW